MLKGRIIAGIDIGTSKITTIIASQSKETDKINVIGVSNSESKGLRRSQIVDIEETVAAITTSVEAAERMAGYSLSHAFISIGGVHIESLNSKGVVAIAEPEGEIVIDDVNRVVEAARAVSLPASREILHVIPRDFTVDSQSGISDPLGMTGVRLEVETHIITGFGTAMRNLTKCIQELGIDVDALVFSGLAASESILTATEKELGVCLVDIGGGSTSMAVFIDGALSYSCVLPVGARNVTNDLAIGLRVSLDSAEKIKRELYRKENEQTKDKEKTDSDDLELKNLGLLEDLHKVSKKTLVEGIIRPRLNEIFQMVGDKLKESGFEGNTPAGIVLSGGGAKTVGISNCCKRTLSLPVRIGLPQGLTGLTEEISSSDFATSYGLILYGIKNSDKERKSSFNLHGVGNFMKKVPVGGAVKKVFDIIKSFLP